MSLVRVKVCDLQGVDRGTVALNPKYVVSVERNPAVPNLTWILTTNGGYWTEASYEGVCRLLDVGGDE